MGYVSVCVVGWEVEEGFLVFFMSFELCGFGSDCLIFVKWVISSF